ncbi:MAG: 4Fe-4S binding protein [Lachnospiraceae bacterium]|nr:4Fe-4S binding protein [Lachnospiraceae bacterium]
MTYKPIDVEKLRSLGVPEEAIATMDPRDGGNITPQGEVLFLDEERMHSKENFDRPLRVNKPNGLGIRNALATTISKKISPEEAPPVKMFELMINGATWPDDSKKGKFYQWLMGFGNYGNTGSVVFPLNVDLSDEGATGVIPIDMVYSYLEEAEYIAILKMCVCRKAYECKDYPSDLGCIFLNTAGRLAVKNGIGEHVTVEQAKAHVQRAKSLGLAANADMVEIEQLIWGLRNDEMNDLRMICFCCPCCCIMYNISRNGSDDLRRKRFTSCGFTTTVNHDKCVGCHKCQSICPKHAITYREDGKCVIDQDSCFGCGFCKSEYEYGALTVKQTFPMRDSLNDYFVDVLRIDDGRPHSKVVKHEEDY